MKMNAEQQAKFKRNKAKIKQRLNVYAQSTEPRIQYLNKAMLHSALIYVFVNPQSREYAIKESLVVLALYKEGQPRGMSDENYAQFIRLGVLDLERYITIVG